MKIGCAAVSPAGAATACLAGHNQALSKRFLRLYPERLFRIEASQEIRTKPKAQEAATGMSAII